MAIKRSLLNKAVEEKIGELRALCVANKVPYAVICGVESNGKTETVVDIQTPAQLGVSLSTDKISPLVALVGTDKFKITKVKEKEVFDESIFIDSE